MLIFTVFLIVQINIFNYFNKNYNLSVFIVMLQFYYQRVVIICLELIQMIQ